MGLFDNNSDKDDDNDEYIVWYCIVQCIDMSTNKVVNVDDMMKSTWKGDDRHDVHIVHPCNYSVLWRVIVHGSMSSCTLVGAFQC